MATSTSSDVASKAAINLSALRATVASTLALLSTFQSSLTSTSPSRPPDMADPPNPLRLLSDACSLLKAQTTKLSLLILNKPFTPTAISFILKNLSTECLPALMTGLELCISTQYTVLLGDHIRADVSRIMRELTSLLGTIPTDGKALSAFAITPKEGDGRDTLPSTGVIWEVCDNITALAANGLVDLAVKKADAYHALIKDAIVELEGWNPDEDEDDPFGSRSSTESGDDVQTADGATSESPPIAAMNTLTLTPPATPTPIRQIYEQTLAALRLIRLLYPALRKRRISTFPNITSSAYPNQMPSAWQIQMFDNLLIHMRTFSEVADELAGALYSQDEDQASDGLETIKMHAKECVANVGRSWERNEDEFTAWSSRWIKRLDELSPSSGA